MFLEGRRSDEEGHLNGFGHLIPARNVSTSSSTRQKGARWSIVTTVSRDVRAQEGLSRAMVFPLNFGFVPGPSFGGGDSMNILDK
jgi:hypothetical protein